MKALILICLLGFTSGCSTAQKSRLATTAIAAGAGITIGYASAPGDENKQLHGLCWGGVLGLMGSVAANYYYDDAEQNKKLVIENERLKAQMDFFSQNQKSQLVREAKADSDNSPALRGKGKTKILLYKIDQWVDGGPNIKYHQDQKIEIITESP